MISVSDVVRLLYTSDLTEGGIAYACQTLPRMLLPAEVAPLDHLRRMVASVAVQLAFRRCLAEKDIPFTVTAPTPFTDPARFDITLGRRRCEIRTFLISHSQQVDALEGRAELTVGAPALIPLEQFSAEGQSDNDLYLFAFVTSLPMSSAPNADALSGEAPPAFLIHLMPREWARPDAWIPLGPLALKSDSDRATAVEIGGQGASREFVSVRAVLPPRTRVELDVNLHSLTYAHAVAPTEGRLGIHSRTRAETYVIQPGQWGDIWVRGLNIFLMGWITREEFHLRARLIPEGASVFQFKRTRTKNLAAPMSQLKPIDELLERVRSWEAAR